MGIRARLIALTLGFAIPLAATGLVGLEWLWSESRHQLDASVRKQSELAAAAFERWIEAERQPLVALAASAAGRPETQPLTVEELRSVVRAHPNWIAIEARSETNVPSVSFPTSVAPLHSDLTASLLALLGDGTSSVVEVNWEIGGGRPVMLVAARIEDGGELIARLDATSMKDVLREIEIPSGGVITLFDPKFRILLRSPNGEAFVGRDMSDSPGFAALQHEKSIVTETVSRNDGVPRVYGTARVGRTGCIVGVGVPSATLYEPARQQFDRYLLFSLVALVCAVVASVVIARKISGPVRQLGDAARGLGAGDFTVRAPDDGDSGEIAELGRVFNRMAASLEEREAKLAELDRLKSDFVSAVSHELRTPLTTIKTLTQVLQRGGESSEDRRRFLDVISTECDRQIDFVLDLLDLSRIEAGAFTVEPECVDVAELIEAFVATERFGAEAAGVELVADVQPDLPYVRAERVALRRVVRCLTENAVKYTPAGGRVVVSAAPIEAAVVLTVRDTGSGIAADDLPHLFEKFFRSSDADEHHGVGLGLFLAHSIVSKFDGTISVESEVGHGSAFSVTLHRWTAEVVREASLEESREEASVDRR